VNAAGRLLILAFFTLAAALCANVASAFQLGEIKFHNSAKRFEFRIPVHDLERDASSKLTGTVYSQNNVVDLLSYGIESAGETLEFVATTDRPVSESFVFVVEMSYRGQVTGRRYVYDGVIKNKNTASQDTTTFSLTPGKLDRFVPAARFNLNLKHTTHVVADGQTLWDIAVDCEAIGGNNFQRSLAIFAANPKKFVNGDINQLSVNTTLDIPKQSYVDMFSPSEAASVFYKLATGALAMDATFDEVTNSAPETNTSTELPEKQSTGIEITASREVPTEQAMLARRIDSVEARLRAILEDHNVRVSESLSDLEKRIENLEAKKLE